MMIGIEIPAKYDEANAEQIHGCLTDRLRALGASVICRPDDRWKFDVQHWANGEPEDMDKFRRDLEVHLADRGYEGVRLHPH